MYWALFTSVCYNLSWLILIIIITIIITIIMCSLPVYTAMFLKDPALLYNNGDIRVSRKRRTRKWRPRKRRPRKRRPRKQPPRERQPRKWQPRKRRPRKRQPRKRRPRKRRPGKRWPGKWREFYCVLQKHKISEVQKPTDIMWLSVGKQGKRWTHRHAKMTR